MSLEDSPFKGVKIVIVSKSVRDEALADDMEFDEYARTRDENLIKEKAGAFATRVWLEAIKPEFVCEAVDSFDSDSQRFTMAFLAACAGIEKVQGKPERPKRKKGRYDQLVAPPEFLATARAMIGIRGVYEAGKHALERAYLPEGKEPSFAL